MTDRETRDIQKELRSLRQAIEAVQERLDADDPAWASPDHAAFVTNEFEQAEKLITHEQRLERLKQTAKTLAQLR